jgi:hypothetical protein
MEPNNTQDPAMDPMNPVKPKEEGAEGEVAA